ncbi:MAG: PIN domain-containing protein [Solirubrobacteraceae bacterium]
MTLVLDAGPLVASTDRRDRRRLAVQRILREEQGPLVLPAPVSAEVDYLLGRRVGEAARRGFLGDLAERRFDVECLTEVEYSHVAALERQYADLSLGLADLSMVVIAARLRCTRILTFDERHFRAIRPLSSGAAFTLLPADA